MANFEAELLELNLSQLITPNRSRDSHIQKRNPMYMLKEVKCSKNNEEHVYDSQDTQSYIKKCKPAQSTARSLLGLSSDVVRLVQDIIRIWLEMTKYRILI
eukprot:g11934.t1